MALKATSSPLVALSGLSGTPCRCHTPCRSIKMSRGSYLSLSKCSSTLAPVLSDTSYSLLGPPRKTPTTVRIQLLYTHLLARTFPVIRNSKAVRLGVGQQNVALAVFNNI